MTRVFQPVELRLGAEIVLNESASHYLSRVLRAKINDLIRIFNGKGGEFLATIIAINKKEVWVLIKEFIPKDVESPLELYLAQGISRGEKMDFTIQKAVELGVKKIIPLFTEYSTVKLADDRLTKRWQHWQSIVISACEQSGRNVVPDVLKPDTLENSLKTMEADWCFALSPHVNQKLQEIKIQKQQRVILLIGPEGGLSSDEIQMVAKHQFLPLNLGPRVLRTETAAIAAITALQCLFGDMS